jgi:hypothetical protein
MRRSICYCEPQIARAGQVATWKFHYTTAVALQEGAKLKFDIQSHGRDIDWEAPTSDISAEANVIYMMTEKGDILTATEIQLPDIAVPQFEFTLEESIKAGGKLIIVMGAAPSYDEKDKDLGNECQLTTQRRRSFHLYVDAKGKGNYEDPELFSIDIRGNLLHTIRILTPSFVAKNKRFDITVRFEDEFGNLTNFAPEETLIDLSYEHLRENLNWKLFVPETGFVILPNLYFNEAGVYRVQLINLHTKEKFISAPIKCFQENNRMLLWGQLHGESERVDATENIEACLHHFRDDKAYNFFATSNFESTEETSNEIWKLISQNIADFNEEDRFVTMLGFQYAGEGEGLRHVLYFKDNKPILRTKDNKTNSIGKLYRSLTNKEIISVPSFTMGGNYGSNFENAYPEIERLIEIYNAWGSSECTKEEGNLFPITGCIEENKQGSIQDALKQNRRFGFVAGGLDDRGIYGKFFDSAQVQYSPGMTGIICEKYTRESVMEALYKRSTYATTGARIIVGFYIAGQPMGSELNTTLKPGLKINRHISGYVAGTDTIKQIELIRAGRAIHTILPKSYHCDYYYDDMEPLDQILLTSGNNERFIYYYLRVTQEDGHVAWSSPIWIDAPKPQ